MTTVNRVPDERVFDNPNFHDEVRDSLFEARQVLMVDEGSFASLISLLRNRILNRDALIDLQNQMDNLSEQVARVRDAILALRPVAPYADFNITALDSEMSLYQAFIDTINSLTNDQLLGYYFDYLLMLNII